MTPEEYELIFDIPDWLKKWRQDCIAKMVRQLDAEILGHPVIVSPIVPEDEVWINDGEKIIKIKLSNDDT